MDYAKIDEQKILQYIQTHDGECIVNDIILFSGAESLRTYPIIYRLKYQGIIEIIQYDELGSPKRIRLK